MSSVGPGSCTGLGLGGFDREDWLPALREEYADQGSKWIVVFGKTICLSGPDAFFSNDECQTVSERATMATAARMLEIKAQATEDGMIYAAAKKPLLDAGVPSLQIAAARRVARIVLAELAAPIYTLKAGFNRARPWKCCSAVVDPDFKNGGSLYPGHPSYPSGHSTEAHTLAYLWSQSLPALRQPLLENAGRIAVNREVAGLHYVSDTLAGRWLGEQLADAILNAPPQHQTANWKLLMTDFAKLGKP